MTLNPMSWKSIVRLMPAAACAILTLIALAPCALAAGLNLRWNDCYGDGGLSNRTFACNTNSGNNSLLASFVLDAGIPGATGETFSLDITTAAASLPAWWDFKNAGACRQTSLLLNTSVNFADSVCVDWMAQMGSGGIGAYTVGVLGPNTARLTGAMAVANGRHLAAGSEYFSFRVTILNAKTVGAGSCSGCSTPACVAFSSMTVTAEDPANDVTLTTPAYGTGSNYVSWQDDTSIVPFPSGTCAFDTLGFAITTSVVGRGNVARSRTKVQYPPGSPVGLYAIPLPGDRFISWSGDTATVEDTLNVIVNRPLSYTATFEKDPAAKPQLLGVTDSPGDQGGIVLVHWQRSPLDGVTATGFLGGYHIQRQAPAPPGAPWIEDQIYSAVQAPVYELAAHTPADSTAADPALYRFRVVAMAAGDTLTWTSNELLGHSVDNLAPPAPTSVSGSMASGVATMFWPAVSAPDVDHYAIYRAPEAPPPIDVAHRIGTTTTTGFTDSPGYFANYRVTAFDVHGNEGQATAFVPSNTTNVDGRETPHALTVGSPVPSPMGRFMSMSIGLPVAMSLTADVLDAQGRLVRRLAEGKHATGWLDLRWDARDADGRDSAAGVYFVRVHTLEGDRFRRLVLLP